MATGQYQLGGMAIIGGDLPFHNYGVADIGAGLGVLADTSNVGTTSLAPGVVLPTASAGVAKTIGVTLNTIPAGKGGLVRVYGVSVCTASGTVTYGETVQLDDTTSKLGWVKTHLTDQCQLGVALGTSTDGTPVKVLHFLAINEA